MKRLLFLIVALIGFSQPLRASFPCCAVTAVDVRTGTVTAVETATGRTFEFHVTNTKLLATLHAGSPVYANFSAKQVSLDGKTQCCAITKITLAPALAGAGAVTPVAPPASAAPRVAPAPGPPCCAITAIDSATGVVTAKENASGKLFQFKVADAALLKTLQAGQGIYANFGARKVSVDGSASCCTIVSEAAAPMAAGQIQNKLKPSASCCIITAMDSATGVVTAKENATGRTITFRIAHFQPLDGAKLSQIFTVGGKVDFQPIDSAALTSGSNGRLTVQGFQPVDGIVASIR
jgi:Cu/Ag efflux protein CusF